MGISKVASKVLRYVYISVGILAIEILAVKGSSMRTYVYQDKDRQHQQQGYARRGYSSSSVKQHDVVEIEEFVLMDIVGLPQFVTSSDLKSLEETFVSVYNNQQQLASTAADDAKILGKKRRGGSTSTRPMLDYACIIPDAIDPNPHQTTSQQEIVYSTDGRSTMISMVNVTYLMIVRGEWDHACAQNMGNDFQLFGGGTATTNFKTNPNSRILFDQVTDGTGNGDSSNFGGGEFVSSKDNDGIMQKFRSIQNNNDTIHDDEKQHHNDRGRQRNFLVGRYGDDDYQKPSLGRDCDARLSSEDFIVQFNRFFNTRLSNSTFSGNVAGLVGVQQVTTLS